MTFVNALSEPLADTSPIRKLAGENLGQKLPVSTRYITIDAQQFHLSTFSPFGDITDVPVIQGNAIGDDRTLQPNLANRGRR